MYILLALAHVFMLGVIAWNVKSGFLIIEERLKNIEDRLKTKM